MNCREQVIEVLFRRGQGIRGKDGAGKPLPSGEDVCMNYIMIHKPVDGVSGIAYKPGHEFEGRTTEGAWSDSIINMPMEIDGKIGAETRRAYGRSNTGLSTTSYLAGAKRCNGGVPTDFDLGRSGRTMSHELGHSHASRHDYVTERPLKTQCRPRNPRVAGGPNRYIMDYALCSTCKENAFFNTQTGVYKFSTCSTEDISIFIWDRRHSGLVYQGDLGKCKGINCGDACSGKYCDFNTGQCRLYKDAAPYKTYVYNMNGWPCDTKAGDGTPVVGYCRNNKCEKKLDADGKPRDLQALYVTLKGNTLKKDPWLPGVYTRSKERSGGTAVWVKQAMGDRYYSLSRRLKTTTAADGKVTEVSWQWIMTFAGPNQGAYYELDEKKAPKVLDWLDFIGTSGLPWTSFYQGQGAKLEVLVEPTSAICQHILVTGFYKAKGRLVTNPRLTNVFEMVGVFGGRPFYSGVATTWTKTGQHVTVVRRSLLPPCHTFPPFFFSWVFSRPGVCLPRALIYNNFVQWNN